MTTFEERYTAWIDGQLTGDTLVSFEQELARRAAAGDAEAETDKTDALRLRALLKEHLQAPALTNTEFFSHQMRERIDAEADKAARRREATARPAFRFPAFAWPFARLAGAGAACLFVAAALYYGLMPPRPGTDTDNGTVAKATPAAVKPGTADNTQLASNGSPAPAPQVAATPDRTGPTELALRPPLPSPVIETNDLHARVLDAGTGNTTAVPLQLKDPNVNVLWVDGLNYIPNVPGTPVPASAAASPATSATAPAASPGVNP